MSAFDKHLMSNFTDTSDSYSSVFEHFDKNKDGYLHVDEFHDLLQDLTSNNTNNEHLLTDGDVSSLFAVLDLDNDGRLSLEEFRCAWLYWLSQILKPVKALVIVDVQNDFISGNLSLQGGSEVVPVINKLLDQNLFDIVVYTYDWHPENHISFVDNIGLRKLHPSSKVSTHDAKLLDKVVFDVDGGPREQILWPRHCTQGSWGSELHDDLKVVENAYHVKKGLNPDVDSYSAFWDNDKLSRTELSTILGQNRITDVYVCGLAYDVCVGFTANHATEHGFRTVFIEDAARGVTPEGQSKVKAELMAKGVYFTDSNQVPSLTRAEQRPVCLTAQAALNYKLAWKLVKKKSAVS